jgi:thymidylate synthase ThyX
MPAVKPSRVITVAPMPSEKCAYALARYSRSPDSIRQSIDWVRTHNSQSFLESFYFQYGHASIADLGHVVVCFEGMSELAATEIEDENLWDGQAKSSRYQDFSKSGFVTPTELTGEDVTRYGDAARALLDAYQKVNALAFDYLSGQLPRPEEMKPDAYKRNIAARAFDVARYLLFWGIPTNIGQVTSIRTLERQIRRLKASEYGELRSLGDEIGEACAREPDCEWSPDSPREALAPTLARHAEVDAYAVQARSDLTLWARQNLPAAAADPAAESVDLIRPRKPPPTSWRRCSIRSPIIRFAAYTIWRRGGASRSAAKSSTWRSEAAPGATICYLDSGAGCTRTTWSSTSAPIVTCIVIGDASSSGKPTPARSVTIRLS